MSENEDATGRDDVGRDRTGAGSEASDGPVVSLKARDDVVSRQVDEEWVLYDPVSEKMHVLNPTAALVWNHLDGAHTLDEIIQRVHTAFDPPAARETVSRDVRAVLDQFADEGLLD